MIKIGLIINPYAGIGGAVALKGSDGAAVVQEALARGAQRKAQERARQCLELLVAVKDSLHFFSVAGEMGGDVLAQLGFEHALLPLDIPLTQTSAAHTRALAQALLDENLSLILFAGGDGTARDICKIIGEKIPVLGIPAGVKIHSAVYGITPKASAEVVLALVRGTLVDISEAEVRDLDEDAFRLNQVRAKHYGEMRVPRLGHFVQAVKQGGVESQELVLADIAAWVGQHLAEDELYFIGSGKTTAAIMQELNLPNTLLGVDAIYNGKIVAQDLTSAQILALLNHYEKAQAIVSVMGGQGHIFGRGNQQFSAEVLRKLGKERIQVVSAKSKITELNGRPLIMDSGDSALDAQWAGTIEIITGYNDRIVYPLI